MSIQQVTSPAWGGRVVDLHAIPESESETTGYVPERERETPGYTPFVADLHAIPESERGTTGDEPFVADLHAIPGDSWAGGGGTTDDAPLDLDCCRSSRDTCEGVGASDRERRE